jgi:hypothetical protein
MFCLSMFEGLEGRWVVVLNFSRDFGVFVVGVVMAILRTLQLDLVCLSVCISVGAGAQGRACPPGVGSLLGPAQVGAAEVSY